MTLPERSDSERLKDLFAAALDLPAEERGELVRRTGHDDAALGAQLENLLRAHDGAGDFLTHPRRLIEDVIAECPGLDDPDDDGLSEGDRVGSCELIERLATGGFGSVWRARQLAPAMA